MILESAQLLSTAHRVLGSKSETLYKATHINHPCNIWCRSTQSNYLWLWEHFSALLDEYTYRYNKYHKSGRLLSELATVPKIGPFSFTEPPCCMPDEFKGSDPVTNYREYYRIDKAHLHKWTKRNKPDWIES